MSKATEIDNQISDLATKMAKSTTDHRTELFNTIMDLGPEGLKKAVANLSPAEKELLGEALVEMKKAANMPEPTPDKEKLTAKKTETPAKKMKTESLSGSDDQDEKLMENENAEHPHQGGPKDKPEGWEGEVIKGKEMNMEQKSPPSSMIMGHVVSGKPMYANHDHPSHKEWDHKDHKDAAQKHSGLAQDIRSKMDMSEKDEKGEAKDRDNHVEMYSQARMHEKNAMEHMKQGAKKEDSEMEKCYGSGMHKSMKKLIKKSYENFMTKAEGKNMKKADESAPEMEAKNPIEGEDQPKKKLSPEQKLEKKEMKKAKKIKKSLRKIVKMAKSLKMSKDEVVKAIKAANNNLKLVKAEMKAKMLKEEDQVKMAGQDKKEAGDIEQKINKDKGDLEIKADQTADEAVSKVPKMEKSVKWNMKSSIAANSLGRNTHYDVDSYIESADATRKEVIKKGGYFNDQEPELKKSDDKKVDLNDLIEKGMDYSTEEIKRIEGVRDHKADGIKLTKSFHDKDIAAAMGMSEEEYRKFFGE